MAVPPPALSSAKAAMREALKLERYAFVTALSAVEREAASEDLAARLIQHIEPCGVIAAFLPIGDEIDPAPLIALLAEQGATIALPHITRRSEPLRFLRWAPGEPVSAGPFGLSQPDMRADECAPDVILTPLLGFDAMLHRIGYGAGYYDRAFVVHAQARRIGLAWSVQQVDAIPVDPWDVALHAVATEKAWIEP